MKSTRFFIIISLLSVVLMSGVFATNFRVECPEEVQTDSEFPCRLFLENPADSVDGVAFTVGGATVSRVVFANGLEDISENGRYGFAAWRVPFTGDEAFAKVYLLAPIDGSFDVAIRPTRQANTFTPPTSSISVVAADGVVPPPPPPGDNEVQVDAAAVDAVVAQIRDVLLADGSKLQKIARIARSLREYFSNNE